MHLRLGLARMMLALTGVCATLPGLSTPPDVSGEQVAVADVRTLNGIAESRPCAALALLRILQVPASAAQGGSFYLEEIPSRETLAALLDTENGSAFASAGSLDRNPYSSARFYVEVTWSLKKVAGTGFLLNTRAYLVDSVGTRFHPWHEIEPATVVLVADGAARVLDRSSTL